MAGVAVGALGDLVGSLRLAASGSGKASGAGLTYQHRMATAWNDPARSLLLMLSGDDFTAKEFVDQLGQDPAWADALNHPRLQRHELPHADHTCSDPDDRRSVEQLTLAWLGGLLSAATGRGTSPAIA